MVIFHSYVSLPEGSEHGRLTFDDRNLTFEIWVEFNYHPQHRFYMVLL